MPELTHGQAFELGHKHVAKWEGGYFDHPNDPGGVTMFGVSLMFLKALGLVEGDIDGNGVIDRRDVLKITKDKARELFRKHFWNDAKAEKLPPLISMIFYDLAVNAGPGRAAIVLQQAINKLKPGAIRNYAGNVGPLTQKYCKLLAEEGKVSDLAHAYLNEREKWYMRLANARPKSAAFLMGWLNRTDDARKLVFNAVKEYWLA